MAGQLRIAHVSPVYPPYLSGVSTVVWENATMGVQAGHTVHVFAGARSAVDRPVSQEEGVTVHRLRAPIRIGNAPFTPGLLRLNGFDLVHLHYPWYFGAELLRLRLALSATPLLASYHHDVVFPGLLGRVDALHRRTLGPLILRRAAFVTSATLDYARHSSLWRQMGAHTDRIVELGYAVDTERFAPGPPDRALAERTRGEGLLLIFVAALDRAHYHKGLSALLRALADPAVPRARLMVVGEGEERGRYEAESRALRIQDRVHFLGRQSQAGLVQALRTSDALILPSETQSEAFGMVVLEAMACGRPAIVSDLPGLRTLPPMEPPGSLLITPPLTSGVLSACLRTLSPEPLRRRLSEAARARAVSTYSRLVIAARLEELYNATLADRRRR